MPDGVTEAQNPHLAFKKPGLFLYGKCQLRVEVGFLNVYDKKYTRTQPHFS